MSLRRFRLALLAGLCGWAGPAHASVSAPAWLQEAARTPVAVSSSSDAAVLLDEHETTVEPNGAIRRVVHRAVKITNARGAGQAGISVYFGGDTALLRLSGWHIPARGDVQALGGKDAVVISPDGWSMYTDARLKTIRAATATAGSVVGFEFETRQVVPTPFLEELWPFQTTIPVKHARYTLHLPSAWSVTPTWIHYPPTEAVGGVWDLVDIPAVASEPAMPAPAALAGRLGLRIARAGAAATEWSDIGRWYGGITAHSRDPNPEMEAKVHELIGASSGPLQTLQAVTRFMQADIRYVGIELGVGSFVPHPASEVLGNHYGDCKDKATLLSALLRIAGIDSRYLVIHATHGSTAREFPAFSSFNHVILAIRYPGSIPPELANATVTTRALGPMVVFDPTDEHTPLGVIPPRLDGSVALLVTGSSGELVTLPASTASENIYQRHGELVLGSDGALHGTVRGELRGEGASTLRHLLAGQPESAWKKIMEQSMARGSAGASLTGVSVEGLRDPQAALSVDLQLSAPRFAAVAGPLLILQPALVEHGAGVAHLEKRKEPIEYPFPFTVEEDLDFAIPGSYSVDEFPAPVTIDGLFGSYSASTQVKGAQVHFHRTFILKQRDVSLDQLPALKKFIDQVSQRDRDSVVLKRR